MIKKIKKYMWATLSLLAGAFVPIVYSFARDNQVFFYIISFTFFLLGLCLITCIQIIQRLLRVKYAILLFVINKQKELLVVYNKHHNRLMIPCGIIPYRFNPGQVAAQMLKNQTGLCVSDCKIVHWCNGRKIISNNLYPCNTQIEFVTKHEMHNKLHYAFIYVLEVQDASELNDCSFFISYSELQTLDVNYGLFSDLLTRFSRILSTL